MQLPPQPDRGKALASVVFPTAQPDSLVVRGMTPELRTGTHLVGHILALRGAPCGGSRQVGWEQDPPAWGLARAAGAALVPSYDIRAVVLVDAVAVRRLRVAVEAPRAAAGASESSPCSATAR